MCGQMSIISGHPDTRQSRAGWLQRLAGSMARMALLSTLESRSDCVTLTPNKTDVGYRGYPSTVWRMNPNVCGYGQPGLESTQHSK